VNSPKWFDSENLCERSKLSSLKRYLPCSSLKFEQKWNEFLQINPNVSRKFSDMDYYKIVERWNRVGFCSNRGCKISNCTFIVKYHVYHNIKKNVFKYNVLVKGKHGLKFIVEKSTNNSIDMKSYLNDGIIDGSDNRVMMNKVEKQINSTPIYPKMITRKRNYEKRKVVGKWDDSFRKVYSMFKKDMFENFTLVDIDLESLSFTCFINYTDLWNINQIYQFYLDGTFKSKFFRGSHYNLLVFATCLPKSLRTILVTFTVSFKNTGNVYNELWKKIIRVLIKHKIKANFCSLISDMGSGELKFIKNASKIFRHVF
jgi:hypothetical protein